MARDMGPVLKRCRSLGLEPAYLGIDKKSNRSFRKSKERKPVNMVSVKRKTKS